MIAEKRKKDLALLPQSITSKTKTNRDLLTLLFTAVDVIYLFLVQILMDSLPCQRLLSFVSYSD